MELLVTFAVLLSIGGFIGYVLGIIGFFRAGAAMREVKELRRLLDREIARKTVLPTAPFATAPQPRPASAPPPPPPLPDVAQTPADKPHVPPPPPPRPPTPPPAPTPAGTDLEQLLTMRWAVYLGAVALLLAGVFLVRYAAEQGLLGPGMRCAAAVLLGIALLAGATRLKRSAAPPVSGPFADDRAPAALAAGGIAVLFGAAYGAGPFYDLLPAPLAFAAMAAVSFLGLAASLYFGPLTAAVGIVGAFVAPALIESRSPSLMGLFAYLTVATIGAQIVVRRSAWTWLGWAVTIAAAAWVIIAAVMPPNPQIWAAAVFVPVVAAIGLWLPPAALTLPVGRQLAWGQFAIIAAAGIVLEAAAPSGAGRLALFALTPLAIWKGATEPSLDRLPWLAALCGLLALYFWDGGPPHAFEFAAGADPLALISAALLFAGVDAGTGLVLERRAANPTRWSALVAAVPVAALALCYGAVGRFTPDLRWGLCGLLLAGLLALSTQQAMVRQQPHQAGVHAAGAVAALALAFGMTLHDQWLTVALALILPGLAWIEGKVGLRALRPVAMAVAWLTLAILASWLLSDLAAGRLLFTREPFVTYALPALAFAAAAWLFRRGGDDRLVATLEAGAAGAAAFFVALQVRRLFGHRQLDAGLGFEEAAVLMLAFGAQALAYHRVAQRTGRAVAVGARAILGGLALLIAAGLLLFNPAFTDVRADAVSLALAYLLPALAASQVGRFARGPRLRDLLVGYALVAGFAWVTLQVRLLFHPDAMGVWHGLPAEAEMWTWSGAWLLYGCLIMLVGVRAGSRALRYVALALFCLVAAKVFLIDMSELTGLWRVASFLGLGLALIGLGAVYRRFVLPGTVSRGPPRPPEPAQQLE